MNSLPIEVLIHIVEHIYDARQSDPDPNILAVMQVEKRFYRIAYPYLFPCIGQRQLVDSKFLQTVTQYPERARLVKMVSMDVGQTPWSLKQFTALQELEGVRSFTLNIKEQDVDFALQLGAHLEAAIDDMGTFLLQTVPSQISLLSFLPYLQHVQVNIEGRYLHLHFEAVWCIFDWLRRIDNLQTLKIRSTDSGGWIYGKCRGSRTEAEASTLRNSMQGTLFKFSSEIALRSRLGKQHGHEHLS